MSLTDSLPNHATGSRRLTLTMLTARERADDFSGLPAGSAKPYRLLAAFQEAEPYLGLPAHAFKLVSWLVKQTMPCDWEEGARPIAWPSARREQEFLGLSATRVKALNRALFEAGIFVIRDNEQGKRYGRRGPDGRIIEAYGFDLTPLAQRYDEFIRIAAEAKVERARMKALRKRGTIARRAIRQAGEALEALGPCPRNGRV
jgi:replication initiation protein RepC